MAKRKQQQPSSHLLTGFVFIALAIALVFVFSYYFATNESGLRPNTTKLNGKEYTVDLGALKYRFEADKAVKRDDEALKAIKDFLVAEAKAELVHDTVRSAHYQVLASNAAETQLLLGYGVNGDDSAPMFAIKEGDAWKTISPTNKFDSIHRIAECGYVTEHQIDKRLAPVCFTTDSDNQMSYSVR